MICFTVGVVGIYRLGSSGSNNKLEAMMSKSKKFVRRLGEVVVVMVLSAVAVYVAARIGIMVSPHVNDGSVGKISGESELLSEMGDWCRQLCDAASTGESVDWRRRDWIVARKDEVMRMIGCEAGRSCLVYECGCGGGFLETIGIIPGAGAIAYDSCGFTEECKKPAVKRRLDAMAEVERAAHQDVLAGRGKWSFENWRAR